MHIFFCFKPTLWVKNYDEDSKPKGIAAPHSFLLLKPKHLQNASKFNGDHPFPKKPPKIFS